VVWKISIKARKNYVFVALKHFMFGACENSMNFHGYGTSFRKH